MPGHLIWTCLVWTTGTDPRFRRISGGIDWIDLKTNPHYDIQKNI